jgi:hypothetical protein
MNLPRKRSRPKHDESVGSIHGLLQQGSYDVHQLYGTSSISPGLYYDLSIQPTVFDLMNQRRLAIHSTDIEIYSKDPENEVAITAAEVLNTIFEESSIGLREFVSSTFDDIGKYGFCLYNVVFNNDARLELVKVPHYHVREWFTDDNDRLIRVRCNNARQEYFLEEGTFVWFGSLDPGVFWGQSLLSPLLHHFVLYQQQLLNDAESRVFAKGIAYIKGSQDKEGMFGPDKEDIPEALRSLDEWASGNTEIMYLPPGLEVEFKQGNVSSADATENYEKFAAIAREALGSTLKSLGIGGTGSLALGQEVSSTDAQGLNNAVNSYLDILNGFKHVNSNLIDVLLDQLGFDELVGKRIVCFQMVTDEVGTSFEDKNLPTLLAYVEKGLIDFNALGRENHERIYNALGLELPETEETVESSPDAQEVIDDLDPSATSELSEEDPYAVSEELRDYILANMEAGNATARALAREILTDPDEETADEVKMLSKRNVSESNWNAIGGDLALDWARRASKKDKKELSGYMESADAL